MAFKGERKAQDSFVRYRADKQTKYWSRIVDGDVSLAKDVDPEILDCATHPELRYRGEGLSLKECWLLYIGAKKLAEEEVKRGKKKKEEDNIEPIWARRVTRESRDSDDGYLHFDQWLYARDRARKDLLWLNREVLGNTLVIERVHQVVCDQFVCPFMDGVYKKDYTIEDLTRAIKNLNRVPRRWNAATRNYEYASQEEIDELENYCRISLTEDARDFFKSTISKGHAVQLMLAIPDVTMIICCADTNLAEIFVKEIKSKFFLAEGGTPSPLHLLFPEYVLRGKDGTSNEPIDFKLIDQGGPRRLGRAYPSLWADSIDSTLSGLHCDFFKLDDVISNSNCNTSATRAKMQNHIELNMSVCDTWGWIDFIGTRYFPDDFYAYLETSAIEKPNVWGIKLFKRAAWYAKPEFRHIKDIRQLEEHMVDLTFPEHADWKFLQSKLKNEYTFRCNYLNEPVYGMDAVDIPRDLLEAHRMNPIAAQSLQGEIIVTGDMAKQAKRNSDYSAFVVMKIFRKQNPDSGIQDGAVSVVVLEVDWGRWTQTQIAEHLAKLVKKWSPKKTHIEDTGGLESFILHAIPDAFRREGVPWFNIYWAPVEQGYDAKRNRIKGLEVLLKAERLFFMEGSWLDETFTQISQYTGAKSTRLKKDDIPDAMAFIGKYIPSSDVKTPEQEKLEADQKEFEFTKKMLQAQHDAMFGTESFYYQPRQVNFEPEEPPQNGIGGISQRIFGRNGMRA